MATAGSGSNNKGKIAIGVVGVLAILGLAGGLGQQTGTQMAADSQAVGATSTSSTPPTHRSETLRAATVPSTTTSSTPIAPPPPVPVMAMTCPAGGSVASPVFGQQITATAPYTVVIDYGDGDVYTNDDQHLAAIFSHTYGRAGAFTVKALLTDATGQTAAATCSYNWTAPAPVVRSGGTSSGTGGSNTSSGSSSGGAAEVPTTGGPSAICNDGTTSYSQHRQGTCSHHGGVAQWLI
jgi:hypothetical protein